MTKWSFESVAHRFLSSARTFNYQKNALEFCLKSCQELKENIQNSRFCTFTEVVVQV